LSDRAASAHHPALAHHFPSLRDQREASSFGMWLFLSTEVLFFGGLFFAYLLYRTIYAPGFAAGIRHQNVTLGTVNTAVLIASSLTMAMAVHSASRGRRQPLLAWLFATILLGGAFLGVKVVEYAAKFEHHLVPGRHFAFEGPFARQAELYFSLYFVMTGLHALHMIIGVGVMAALAVLAFRGRFTAAYHAPVELAGLYWHFVDVIWIFLFPLLYLVG
jgi:cytochrome c oxidase subunit 3